MRDRAAFETERGGPRADRRGDRTGDRANELGHARLGPPRGRLLGKVASGNQRRAWPAGAVGRRSGYDSALDESSHHLTRRMSRPFGAFLFLSGAAPAPKKSRDLALESGLREVFHSTTEQRDPKVAPTSLDRLAPCQVVDGIAHLLPCRLSRRFPPTFFRSRSGSPERGGEARATIPAPEMATGLHAGGRAGLLSYREKRRGLALERGLREGLHIQTVRGDLKVDPPLLLDRLAPHQEMGRREVKVDPLM